MTQMTHFQDEEESRKLNEYGMVVNPLLDIAQLLISCQASDRFLNLFGHQFSHL